MRTGLHAGFLRNAARRPEADALVVAGRTWTYGELDRASRALARAVLDVTARPRVGILASRSATAYIAYLAALRSGGSAVPLPVAAPGERQQRLAERSALDVVVADPRFATEEFTDAITLDVEDCWRLAREGWATPTPTASDPAATSDALAYLLFTSGSSGRPKGVPVRHRHTEHWLPHVVSLLGLRPTRRFAQVAELTFDAAVEELFGAWTSGATVVVPDQDELFDPVTFITRSAITHWSCVPSLVSLSHDDLRPGSLPSLETTIFGGETLTLAQAERWAAAAPRSRVINSYGPTETVVDVAAHVLPADRSGWPKTSNGTVPIGRVFPHLEAHVVPATQELLVRGSQRFDGYLDPADDDGRFAALDGAGDVRDPVGPVTAEHWYRTGDRVATEGGELVHLGRTDEQFKLMGQRIEPAEIEHGLRCWGGVRDAAVLLLPGTDGRRASIGAVVTGTHDSPVELRTRLLAHLPLAYVPRTFVVRQSLPVGTNGKTDRAACRRLLEEA